MIIAKSSPVTIETAALTDAGVVGSHNEDSVAVVSPANDTKKEKGTLLVVADGLGGYNAGEVASALVTSKLPELYLGGPGEDQARDLVTALETCNAIVHDAGKQSPNLQGMGSTVVAALVVDQAVVFANVGDSRGYLLRGAEVIHRTTDHSLRNSMIDVPAFGARNRLAHVLTRAIGPRPSVTIDVTAHRIRPGDTVLLCSDGLSDCVDEEDIISVVSSHSCADASAKLVSLAKQRGGKDDISVVLAKMV